MSERSNHSPQSAWARQRRKATMVILAVPLAALLVLFVLPMIELFWLSFSSKSGLTLANYLELSRPVYASLTLYTFKISLLITLLCLLIGCPLAYFIARIKGPLSHWIALFLVMSLWLSILTRTYGWVALLQRNGVINNLLIWAGIIDEPLPLLYNSFGVVMGMLHLLLPFMVITLLPTFRAIDDSLIRAALCLGASPLRTFFKVFVPLTLPGVVAGSILVFVLAIGYFVTPAILGGGHSSTIAMAIKTQVLTLVDLPLAAATSVTLLVISVAALLIYEKFSGVDRVFGGGTR
ncbi:MAG: ABC transporter permease [Mesorhizobium sp.]